MDEVRCDLFNDDTPDLTEFPPLPEGQHLFEVIKVKPGTAKSSGRGRFGLQVKIIGGEHDDKKGWHNLNLPVDDDEPDAYIRKVWRKLAALVPDAVTKSGVKPDMLIGLQFRGTVTHEMYQDKPQARIKNETWLGMKKADPAATAGFSVPAGS